MIPRRNDITTSPKEVEAYINSVALSEYGKDVLWNFYNFLKGQRAEKDCEMDMELFSYMEIQELFLNNMTPTILNKLNDLLKHKKKLLKERPIRFKKVNELMKKVEVPSRYGLTNLKRSGVYKGPKLYNGTTKSLWDIVKYLDVENKSRYKPIHHSHEIETAESFYAADFAAMCGAYIPIYWWRPHALSDLLSEKKVKVILDETVYKLTRNDLFDWFVSFSHYFGWTRLYELSDGQAASNKGKLVIYIAGSAVVRRDKTRISIGLPNRHGIHGSRDIPVQTWAWEKNTSMGREAWWKDEKYNKVHVYAYNL